MKSLTGNPTISEAINVDDFIRELSKDNDVHKGESDVDDDSGSDEGNESDNELGERGRSNKKLRVYESRLANAMVQSRTTVKEVNH